MKSQAVKLEITNNITEDRQIEWFFCDTNEEIITFYKEKELERKTWNYHTIGAQSTRYYFFTEYTMSSLLEMNISELQGMTVKEFIEIVKSQLK